MTDLAVSDALFFEHTGMDPNRIEALVDQSLAGMDDGELYLEYSQSESLALDDGRVKSASFDTTQGFGLRAVAGEAAGYAHASELSEAAIRRAADTVRAVASGHSGVFGVAGSPIQRHRCPALERHRPVYRHPGDSAFRHRPSAVPGCSGDRCPGPKSSVY